MGPKRKFADASTRSKSTDGAESPSGVQAPVLTAARRARVGPVSTLILSSHFALWTGGECLKSLQLGRSRRPGAARFALFLPLALAAFVNGQRSGQSLTGGFTTPVSRPPSQASVGYRNLYRDNRSSMRLGLALELVIIVSRQQGKRFFRPSQQPASSRSA